MSTAALTDRLAASGGRLGEYRGARAAVSYTDAPSEYRTLRSACGVYHLSWRKLISVGGKDRTRWLNGMVSNNIRDLQPGRGVYSFVLNPQGHILGDLYVWNRGEQLLAEIDCDQLPNLLGLLRRYIIMDKVDLVEEAQLAIVGFDGPAAEQVLRRMKLEQLPLEPMQLADVEWRNLTITIARGDRPLAPHFELWAAPEILAPLWEAALSSGAEPVGTDALEMLRIVTGTPSYGKDIRERDLPQETGQDRALNYNKGCYIGQEIVERIRARGRVHRTLAGFRFQADPPPGGSKVVADGKEVGEITSSTRVPGCAAGEDVSIGIGYLRRESAEQQLSVNGFGAELQPLPFNL
jgi:aminomethyltransferase